MSWFQSLNKSDKMALLMVGIFDDLEAMIGG